MLHFLWSGYSLTENSYTQYESSNLEIAKWAEYYLGQKTCFYQSSWLSGKVTENPKDILLGHLTWDGRSPNAREPMGKLLRNWVKDNALSPDLDCHPNTYILTPWVPEFPLEWMTNMIYRESQLLSAHKIFALCGKYWIDRTLAKQDDSLEFKVAPKLVHCNMGVAAQNFPIIKTQFNKIGERQLLHISNLGSYKGFDVTCESVEGLNTLLHVASGSIQASLGLIELTVNGKNHVINFMGTINNNDPDVNQWIVENCDFYIHTGTMDAQATVILESCARGLIPLVTPESGFASPHAIYLTHDPDENRKIIEYALNLPESDLMQRSHLLRKQVMEENNWESIFGVIWKEISADLEF